jgi:hypothetical protein
MMDKILYSMILPRQAEAADLVETLMETLEALAAVVTEVMDLLQVVQELLIKVMLVDNARALQEALAEAVLMIQVKAVVRQEVTVEQAVQD